MTEKQRTLIESISLQGIGLHTGENVTIEICPAPENHGYKFQRIYVPEQPIIKADVDLVFSTERGTPLEFKGA
jgi:UDP-3-O-[3-hydroxymyristoyl] N-acetylglucosamine deacetylase/3-hydroxyacyl-[acyl-carrier-protein] dehydratase